MRIYSWSFPKNKKTTRLISMIWIRWVKLDNNSLLFIGLFGYVFSLNKSFTNIYGNATLKLALESLVSWKAIFEFTYLQRLLLRFRFGFWFPNGIPALETTIFKYDFKNYISDKFKLNYGVNGIYYVQLGTIKPSDENSGINFAQLIKKICFWTCSYINADHEISDRIALSYGLRYSMFYRLGQSTVNIADNNPVTFNSLYRFMKKQPNWH
jgi:hypothetical protein